MLILKECGLLKRLSCPKVEIDLKYMKIAAIVILYNPNNSVIDNIKSYVNYVDLVIAIDNSTQYLDCIEKIKQLSKLEYISLNGNFGIAMALNVGIVKAHDLGCSWMLTMDQDSSFENDIIRVYKEYIYSHNTEDIAVLCPIYIYDRHRTRKQSRYKQVSLVMQSANLLNFKAYEIIGPYNDELFIDCVDYDYCFRIYKKQFKIIQCADAKLRHSPAETKILKLGNVNLIRYGSASPLRYYYQARNLLYLVRKFKSFKMLGVLLCKLFKIFFLFNNKRKYILSYRTGIIDCVNNKFGRKVYE